MHFRCLSPETRSLSLTIPPAVRWPRRTAHAPGGAAPGVAVYDYVDAHMYGECCELLNGSTNSGSPSCACHPPPARAPLGDLLGDFCPMPDTCRGAPHARARAVNL
eukprot:5309083-Prymnesium_polylepis.2